jgi:hypothetical protein
MACLTAAFSFPVLLQGLWSIQLTKHLSRQVLLVSLAVSFVLGEIAVSLSFIPVTVWIASLFLATVAYISLGLLQHALQDRLFKRTIYEYVGVGVFVLIATLLITPWK